MICAIDIGNSALKVGWFSRRDLQRFERREGLAPSTAVDWIEAELAAQPVDGVIVASVVPAWIEPLQRLASRGALAIIGQASAQTQTHLSAAVRGLGVDRWMGAEAAWEVGRAALTVALGTATTFTVVDTGGTIVGGAISPGLGTSASALASAGAQLFAVPLEVPERLIANETSRALQSGAMFGHAAMVEGMVDRIEREWGSPLAVYLTGGWGERLRPLLPSRYRWDPHLVLRGLARAAELTWGSREAQT